MPTVLALLIASAHAATITVDADESAGADKASAELSGDTSLGGSRPITVRRARTAPVAARRCCATTHMST